jgi:hypothetical protein
LEQVAVELYVSILLSRARFLLFAATHAYEDHGQFKTMNAKHALEEARSLLDSTDGISRKTEAKCRSLQLLLAEILTKPNGTEAETQDKTYEVRERAIHATATSRRQDDVNPLRESNEAGDGPEDSTEVVGQESDHTEDNTTNSDSSRQSRDSFFNWAFDAVREERDNVDELMDALKEKTVSRRVIPMSASDTTPTSGQWKQEERMEPSTRHHISPISKSPTFPRHSRRPSLEEISDTPIPDAMTLTMTQSGVEARMPTSPLARNSRRPSLSTAIAASPTSVPSPLRTAFFPDEQEDGPQTANHT